MKNDNITDRKKLYQLFSAEENIIILNTLMRFIGNVSEKVVKKEDVAKNLKFFKIDKDYYVEDVAVTQSLIILKELTNLEFTAKIRRHPRFTVDAILECKTKEQAEEIKKSIQEKGIECQLVMLSQDKYSVCVPAINVNSYGIRISEAYSQKFQKK